MIAFIGGVMIVLSLCMAFGVGYYLGKDKIEIKRVMNDKDSALYLEAEVQALKAQQESFEQWQRMAKEFEMEGSEF